MTARAGSPKGLQSGRAKPTAAASHGGDPPINLPGLSRDLAAIKQALHKKSALETRLLAVHDELVELRAAKALADDQELALITAEQQLALHRSNLAAAEAALRDVSGNLGALADEHEARLEELKTVKRKYRRAASEAERAKHDAAEARASLELAKAEIARLSRFSPYRLVAGFSAAGRRFTSLFNRRSTKARHAQQREMLRASSLFDAEWYSATNPDVVQAGIDPLHHYLADGWREGRNPSAAFSTTGYLKANGDVAALGINPLVHYLEHGQSEGRGGLYASLAAPRRSTEDFGPPFACAQFPLAVVDPVRWSRHYALAEAGRAVLQIGDCSAGYLPAGGLKGLQPLLARYWHLAGLAGAAPAKTPVKPTARALMAGQFTLTDGWFAAGSLLRMRWSRNDDPAPFVIRAFQPRHAAAEPVLVGEALVRDPLDLVDLALPNALMPVLVLFCDPHGELLGGQLLAFPSLCRGGLHYAEFLAGAGHDPDVLAASEQLAKLLEAIRDNKHTPLLRAIEIDLAGADATQPLFRPDTQDWLATVMRITAEQPAAPLGTSSAVADFLVDRAAGGGAPNEVRSSGIARLHLPADCLPTIAILVAGATNSGVASDGFSSAASLILATTDPSRAALGMSIPSAAALPDTGHLAGIAASYPRLSGVALTGQLPAAALRWRADRSLSDAEWLEPIAQPLDLLPPARGAAQIVVAIEPELWDAPALAAAFAALSLQQGSEAVQVCLIGDRPGDAVALAEQHFADRHELQADWDGLIDRLGDELVLNLGPGVILHDRRTLTTLSAMLATEGAATAACVLVSCDKRGKAWAIAPSDAGEAAAAGDPDQLEPLRDHVAGLWRTVFPVRNQPRDLWLARADVLRNFPRETDGSHLCSAAITASYYAASRDTAPTLTLPAARIDLAMQIEVMAG